MSSSSSRQHNDETPLLRPSNDSDGRSARVGNGGPRRPGTAGAVARGARPVQEDVVVGKVTYLPIPDDGPHPTRTESVLQRRIRMSTESVVYPSSLDFERVVNQYSIQATRDRILVGTASGSRDGDDEGEGRRWSHRPSRGEGGNVADTKSSETAFSVADGTGGYSSFDPDITVPTGCGGNGSLPPPPPPSRSADTTAFSWRLQGKRSPLGYTGRSATRWVLTILTGLLTGAISIVIVSCTSFIERWRSSRMDRLWRDEHLSIAIFALYAATNLALALLSSLLCVYVAPQAVGSGIPEVKAFLNGVRVQRFTNTPLFLVKILGTILSVSSGLVIGPEGPLVHIGAIIGASCTKLYGLLVAIIPGFCIRDSKVLSFILSDLSHFAHDNERRDLVSIGAAAGFAAAFGAPIGGLLFSLEEASSYFEQSMFLKTLAATALATFCLAVHHGNLSDYSVISLGNFHSSDQNIFLNRVEEIPLYCLVGVVGGALGALFCNSWTMLQLLRKRLFTSKWWNLGEVVLVSLVTSSFMYYVPLMGWACRRIDVNDDLVEDKSVFDPWRFHPHQFDCPTGYINELATIFFGSREDAIASILTDPLQFKPRTLWSVGILFFLLMNVTLGVSIPSGIFMPTFLIGSSLGGAAGIYFQELLGREISPSTFALLGAAALLAGIQRSTVSLCVILVEGTGQVKVLIPVIVTIVIARYVADLISGHGLYELAMEVNHYPYLEHHEKKKLDIFRVRDIMSAPPVTLGPRERAYTIVKLMRECEHHGFPVVSSSRASLFSRV